MKFVVVLGNTPAGSMSFAVLIVLTRGATPIQVVVGVDSVL